MQGGVEQRSSAAWLALPSTTLRREFLRALAAFGLYLLAYPAWVGSGAAAAYNALVRAAAAILNQAVGHFPVSRAIQESRLGFYDFLIVFVLAYALASRGMPLVRRIRRVALLVVALSVAHATALVLQTQVSLAREFWDTAGIMLLLPRERQLTIWVKYLLYEFGLQLAPFALIGLWVRWNVGDRAAPTVAGRAPRTRGGLREVLLVSGAIVLAVAAVVTWRLARERDPRHVRAHVWFAERFLRDREWAQAEGQYRAAIDGGCRSGSAFYNLAEIRRRQGDLRGARAVLMHGIAVVTDGIWQETLRNAVERHSRETDEPVAGPG